MLDGRDIGTVICPEAQAKLFVTASTQMRAERRLAQLRGRRLEEVLADIRPATPATPARDVAPMRPAADALLLDTTDLSIEAAVARPSRSWRAALPGGGLRHRCRVASWAAIATRRPAEPTARPVNTSNGELHASFWQPWTISKPC